MGTKVFLGLTGAAAGFMVYALYQFVREGRRQHPRSHPAVPIAVVQQNHNDQQAYSKAA
jgi:hypothetical protein